MLTFQKCQERGKQRGPYPVTSCKHWYPYPTVTWRLHSSSCLRGFLFYFIRGPTVKRTIPWLSRQKPKAGVHSELGSAGRMASPALPLTEPGPGAVRLQRRGPCVGREDHDRRESLDWSSPQTLGGGDARGPGTVQPGSAAPARPQPPGTAAAGDHARPPPAARRGPLTRAGFAQMLLQQRLLQQELEPAGLRRGAGPAGGGRLPVRRLRAHPAPAAAAPSASRLQPDPRRRPGSSPQIRPERPDRLHDSRWRRGLTQSPAPDSRLSALLTNRCWNSEERGGSKRSLRPHAALALPCGEARLSRGFPGPLCAPHWENEATSMASYSEKRNQI